MSQGLSDSRLANLGANAIHQAFHVYQNRFAARARIWPAKSFAVFSMPAYDVVFKIIIEKFCFECEKY